MSFVPRHSYLKNKPRGSGLKPGRVVVALEDRKLSGKLYRVQASRRPPRGVPIPTMRIVGQTLERMRMCWWSVMLLKMPPAASIADSFGGGGNLTRATSSVNQDLSEISAKLPAR